jgi:hypothetical protein
MDRRVRVDQRRALLDEMEAQHLTFAPVINKNSQRIVDRLNKERAAASSAAASATPSASAGGGGSPRSAARRAAAVPPAAVDAQGRPLGRSFLPGHEQETFRPSINPRSAALFRPGIDDKDVYSRLYDYGAGARAASSGASAAGGEPRLVRAPRSPSGGAGGEPASPSQQGQQQQRRYPVDEAGEPAPGHPGYFNALPFDGASGKFDVVLRRLLHTPGGALPADGSDGAPAY